MRYLQAILTAALIWTQFAGEAQAAFLGPAATDEGTFTAGTSPFQPGGCFFQTTATSNPLTTGQQGTVQCTAQRAPFVNLRNSSGTEIGTSGSPIFSSLNATPSLANGNGIVPTQNGSVLSATNGEFANILQGNAVLSTSNPLFITGTGTAGTAATNPITVQGIASMTPLLVNPGTAANWGVGATGSSVPANAVYIAGRASGNATPITFCDNWTPISQTAGTQLFAGTSGKKTYICSINIVTATAQNVALVGGTGTVCATSTHAIAGGATAATGWNFAANGGLTQGNGNGVIMQAGTAADNVCLLQSSTGQISGAISWTQF